MEYTGIIALLVVVAVLLTALSRANERFCVSFRRGQALVVRGRLAAPALAALREVLSHPEAENALVKGFEAEGEIRLIVTGAADEQAQRLNNVLALLSKDLLPAEDTRTRGSWWQFLGFVWLAWWMEGRNQDPPDGPSKSNILPFRR